MYVVRIKNLQCVSKNPLCFPHFFRKFVKVIKRHFFRLIQTSALLVESGALNPLCLIL